MQMLEEKTDLQLAEQFERLLTLSISEDAAPGDLRADLRLVARLRSVNLSRESQIQSRLRAQLAHKMQRTKGLQRHTLSHQDHPPYPPTRPRVWTGVMIAILLLLVLVSNTPVRAALGRLFGYGYLPYAGFVPLADTRVIRGPIAQSTQNRGLTVLQGIADSQRTVLWIGTDLERTELSAAELALRDGTRLPVQAVASNQGITLLTFGPLPTQAYQVNLVLLGGWQFPMDWVAASQAGLAPTQVSVPFQTQTPDGDQSQVPCIDLKLEIQLCAQAAYTDSEGTHLLLQAFQSGQPTLLDWNPIGWESIKLIDEAGRTYPIRRFETVPNQNPSMLSIRFTGVPSNVNDVTLHFPSRAFILPDSPSQQDQPIDLFLRLPDRVPTRSPTPGVVPPGPEHPLAVPTPGSTEMNSGATQ